MSKSIKLKNNLYWSRKAIKEAGYMTAGLLGNKTYTISTAWGYSNLELTTLLSNNGIFSLKDNAIVIPKGITKVRVSGQALASGITYRLLQIYKNNTTVSGGYQVSSSTGYQQITLTPMIIDVVEGDKIYLKYGGGVTGDITFAGGKYTYLHVEEFR